MRTMTLSLEWSSDLRFRNGEGSPAIELASGAPGTTSPPEALAYALMGCMGVDLVHVAGKAGRQLDALSVRLSGQRADEHPRRFRSFTLHFALTGSVPAQVIARALRLSRERYCSVWNSLAPDIELTTTFEVIAPSVSRG